ncbi:hypothetical protein LPJ61_003719 [Coemansia biformis]|uniref:AMP-activated protein kinase glycogen-binding domain-containing protein n=1 Tax=Coemansia biformis TaxID=1286918 RepID=A0A9W7YA07_9FUNG|nr:hypothetical protein LPJ61_003719 [Coemansia biformis]
MAAAMAMAMADDPAPVDTTIEWLGGPADSVAVRGTFSADESQWWRDTIALAPSGSGSGSHRAVLRLRPGRYEFKFVVNGSEWRIGPDWYPTAVDAHGNVNNVLVVPGDGQACCGRQSDVAISVDDNNGRPAMACDVAGRQALGGCASERSGLLAARPASSKSYGGASAQSRAASSAPTTALDDGDGDGDGGAPRFGRLQRLAIGFGVVLLFALLGAVSALYDS